MNAQNEQTYKDKSPIEKKALARHFYHDLGWSLRKIERTLSFSRTSIRIWINRPDLQPKKRVKKKLKVTQEIKDFCCELAKNKWTGKDGASCRKITTVVNKEFNTNLHYTTINSILRKSLSRPIKCKNTFLLNEKQKEKRLLFCKWVIDNQVKGDDIFFTDEKRFYLHKPMNRQTNKIRLSKSNSKKLKEGDSQVFKMVSHESPKYDQGIMVAAGMCKTGVTKLIFCVGTMNSSGYRMALDHYRKEMDRLGEFKFLTRWGCLSYFPNLYGSC